MSNLYKFEVIPFHPTRKVYDEVLFPAPIGYEKNMTVQQAIAAMGTCGNVKIMYNDKWYPVTADTIDAVVMDIDAEKTPAVAEVEPAARAIQSFIDVVSTDTDLYGKAAGMLGDIKIENGDVSGVVYPVTGYTGFNGSVEEEQSGYYLAFSWITNSTYTGATMRVVNGKNPETAITMDAGNVIWLGKGVKDGGGKIIEIAATSGENKVTFVIDSSKLKFADYASPYIAPKAPDVPDEPAVSKEDQPVG